MLFSHFSTYLQKLESTPSRLKMTEILAELFREFVDMAGKKSDNSEISQACYLMQGRLVPSYESLEFQLSVKMVIRALARLENDFITENSENEGGSQVVAPSSLFVGIDKSFSDQEIDLTQINTTKRYKKLGDLGLLAEKIARKWKKTGNRVKESKSQNKLSLVDVYQDLVAIAQEGGAGSQERKLDFLVTLFKKLDAISAKFIARIIIGKLRLGFSTMTMLDALSWAKYGDKSANKILEMAYQKKADVGKLAEVYLKSVSLGSIKNSNLGVGVQKNNDKKVLKNYSLEVGVPIVPALCQRLNTAKEIIEKMEEVIAEPKYDGLRVQIHFKKSGFEDGTKIRAFTRNLENVSHMFPELNELETLIKDEFLILDSEAIGYNNETGELLPFQETITRKRKHDIEETSAKVPIRFFVFDVLYQEGEGLISTPLLERKKLLDNLFQENKTFVVASYIITRDSTELKKYHEEQLAKGLEGVVVKKISSNYLGGRKGWRWVKIKEVEGASGKLKDTLDVVVMGYYFGRGKRSQFGIGALLVGVLDGDSSVKTIAKIGTGLTEERLVSLKKKCDEINVPKKPKNYEVDDSLTPDVWVQPDLVIEVAADEITRSPNHTAGVALRFPRLITVRKDKSWQDATTTEELKAF